MDACVMVMAGGTGGHVFPALAVAEELRQRGAEVFWLGTPDSFEQRLVPTKGFDIELISIKGLRGSGVKRLLSAPFKLLLSLYQALRIVRRRRPNLVIGMGGFVTGPGGVISRLLGIPLVIHEQNAIPGMTNRWLSRIASRILEAFPDSFDSALSTEVTGNPVRHDIATLPTPTAELTSADRPLHLLLIGGSLGAQALNENLAPALAQIDSTLRPRVRHQAGRDKEQATVDLYRACDVAAEVSAFIDDMAAAYAWADLVVCRAGALTVTELAAAGRGAILVPYPHAVDDHQTANAHYLVNAGAALLLPQTDLNPVSLAGQLEMLMNNREKLLSMAQKARGLARPQATKMVADICEEMVR